MMNVALTGLPWQHVSCGLLSCFDYSPAAGELGKQVLPNGLSEGKYVCPVDGCGWSTDITLWGGVMGY